MPKMTKSRKLVYDYICNYIATQGYPPSVREIADAVGFKSISTVHAHLTALANMGYITRDIGRTRSITLTHADPEQTGIPILGSVAAGEPILAVQDALGYIPYDIQNSDEYFALKIRGESMINAGILDGDMVIVHRQETALNGEIVIAMIDDEATCKRLKLDPPHIQLLPENPLYSPIDGTDCVILGKVTGVIRIY